MTARPLEGLRVVDCSADAAGQQATGLLADYGADVLMVEPPGGSPLRRENPAAASVYNRGKRSVTIDPRDSVQRERLLALVGAADVLVEGDSGLAHADFHTRHPHLVCCAISGFGEGDPRRALPAYESLVHALIGTMAVQSGHREGPIYQGLPFATTGAAQLAVLGILAALVRRSRDGIGRRVETSLFDGALAFHSMLWGESDAALKKGKAVLTGKDLRGASKMRLVTRSFVCADGACIGIHTGAAGAFSRLMEVLGLEDRIPPIASGFDMGTPLTPEQADLLEREIHRIFASKTRAEWVALMLEKDICAVEHLPPTGVFDELQAQHNGMIVEVDDPVLGAVEQVAPAIRFDGHAPAVRGAAPRVGASDDARGAGWEGASSWRAGLPVGRTAAPGPLLDGFKVLDLGAFYAGPFSSRLLADLGADIIKLETTSGDLLRGIERPFFAAQAGKRGIAMNLKEEALAPALKGLLSWADAVHHNMRPGAAERVGVSLEQVRAINPKAIYLYAPGWGSSGPHRLRQSFAPMLSAFVGASSEVAGQFNEPLPSVGNEDPGNGLLGAIAMLIALLHRDRTGHALSCENPQLNAAMGMMAHVVRRQADGEVLGAARLDPLQVGVEALDSLYETSDGWICVAAWRDDEIRALERATGLAILSDTAFASLEARRTHRDVLADRLRDIFVTRTTSAWRETLQQCGVPAAVPRGDDCIHELFNDPDQRRTGRVAEVAHPQLGQVREVDRLVRISDAQSVPHRLAPALGAHTAAVLRSLGFAADEIERLKGAGAIVAPG